MLKSKLFSSGAGFAKLEADLNEFLKSLKRDQIIEIAYRDESRYASVLIIYEEEK